MPQLVADQRGTRRDLPPDPLERGEIREGRLRHRALLDLELVEGLAHREGRDAQRGPLVGLVARGDLGLDQRTQQLLRSPALDLRRLQHLRCELPHRAELQALQGLFEVGSKRGGRRAHKIAYAESGRTGTAPRAATELHLEIIAEYSDLISGTGTLKRSDFQRMVTDAREHRFSVLVVYDTSRFARNEADAFTYEATLRAAGARIYYAREGIWSDDRRGALQKGILHVLNAQYSRDLTDRIRDGYAARFARLGLPGGTLPWGYRWSDATATAIALVDDEAAIRRIGCAVGHSTRPSSSRSSRTRLPSA